MMKYEPTQLDLARIDGVIRAIDSQINDDERAIDRLCRELDYVECLLQRLSERVATSIAEDQGRLGFHLALDRESRTCLRLQVERYGSRQIVSRLLFTIISPRQNMPGRLSWTSGNKPEGDINNPIDAIDVVAKTRLFQQRGLHELSTRT